MDKSNGTSYVPHPHPRFQEYLTIKSKVDECIKLSKSSFSRYCDNLVKEGGALYKLIRLSLDRNYDHYCSTPSAAFQYANRGNNNNGTVEHQVQNKQSLSVSNNSSLSLQNHQQQRQSDARKDQNLLPSVDEVRRRLSKYVVNAEPKIASFADLSKISIPCLIKKYQTTYKYLNKYCSSSVIGEEDGFDEDQRNDISNSLKAHCRIYIELYNFRLVEYILKKEENTHRYDDLEQMFLPGSRDRFREIDNASAAAFCMVQSFFIVPIIVPEFRNVYLLFDGNFYNNSCSHEKTRFSNSSYIDHLLSNVLADCDYERVLERILDNGKEAFPKIKYQYTMKK